MGELFPITGVTSRQKSSLGWPLTVWTRWFTGQTSASLPLGEPAYMAGSQPPSFDKVSKPILSLWVLPLAAHTALGRRWRMEKAAWIARSWVLCLHTLLFSTPLAFPTGHRVIKSGTFWLRSAACLRLIKLKQGRCLCLSLEAYIVHLCGS